MKNNNKTKKDNTSDIRYQFLQKSLFYRYQNQNKLDTEETKNQRIKSYLVVSIIVNIISISLLFVGINNILTKNKHSDIELIRVDGIKVQETHDVRRNVLINGVLLKMKANQGG